MGFFITIKRLLSGHQRASRGGFRELTVGAGALNRLRKLLCKRKPFIRYIRLYLA